MLGFFSLNFSKYLKFLIIQNVYIKKGPGEWKNSGVINIKITVRRGMVPSSPSQVTLQKRPEEGGAGLTDRKEADTATLNQISAGKESHLPT